MDNETKDKEIQVLTDLTTRSDNDIGIALVLMFILIPIITFVLFVTTFTDNPQIIAVCGVIADLLMVGAWLVFFGAIALAVLQIITLVYLKKKVRGD